MDAELPFALRLLTTYGIHSTLLLAAAWGAVRVWRAVPPAAEERIWRIAWLGGLGTALVTALWPAVQAAPLATARIEILPEAAAPVAEGAARAGSPEVVLVVPTEGAAPTAPEAPAGSPALPLADLPLADLLLAAYLGVAGIALLRLCLGHVRFRRRLRGRVPISSGPLREALDRVGSERRIRLATSPRLAGPVAFGLLRPEIVVPSRALTDLSPAEQESMLAHEAAHVARHDPLWLALGRVLDRVLFVQPLNLLATRRLRRLAEIRCDDWAVARTGSGLALAECLARVATWMGAADATAPAAASAMAGVPADVTGRVERLLAGKGDARSRPVLVGSAAMLALALVALLAPRVATASSAPRPMASSPVETADPTSPLAFLDVEIAALEREAAEVLALVRGRSLSLRSAAAVERVLAQIQSVRAARERLREDPDMTPPSSNPGDDR